MACRDVQFSIPYYFLHITLFRISGISDINYVEYAFTLLNRT